MNALPPATASSGILTLAQLQVLGYDRYLRAAAISEGRLERLRNGWFALPGTPEDLRRAVRLGGKLTCGPALDLHGVWVLRDDLLHVSVSGNAARLRSPDDRRAKWVADEHPDVRLHWRGVPVRSHAQSGLDGVLPALAHLVTCGTTEAAIVSLDSALNTVRNGRPLLSRRQLEIMLEVIPERSSYLDLVDGRSQAGTETLVRLRLRRRGVRVKIQVQIARIGRVDLLVGDRLIIEVDSRRYHLGENYESDRRRDPALMALGFIVLRLSYYRVMFDWPAVEEEILAIIRRGEHLRLGRHRGLALADAQC